MKKVKEVKWNKKIKRKQTKMKKNIYGQFQAKDKIERNQNFYTEKIKGFKTKPKIKRIRTKIKINIWLISIKGLNWNNSKNL